MSVIILGIESSCDDTSAAVIRDGVLLRHVAKEYLSAIGFTRGPGLLGSLLVGTSFAKGMSLGLRIPIVDVNHLHGHVLSHFIRRKEDDRVPDYPFICLLVSGGNSQIILVRNYNDMEILGQTIDDAAGEAFDKCAKVMGLPYPGGPHIDRLAAEGDPKRFRFAKPHIPGLDYSFSGLKTSFLYTLRDEIKKNPDFIEQNKADLAASLQRTIIDILMDKLDKAVRQTGVTTVAIGGGVSANSGVRDAVADYCKRRGLTAFIPERVFTTDNAAMVAIAAYYKYLDRQFCRYDEVPYARVKV